MTPLFDQFQKFSFAYDLDVLTVSGECFSLSVFCAFGVSCEKGEILISDDQMAGFLGHAGFNFKAYLRGEGGGFGALHAEVARKDDYRSKELAFRIGRSGHALGVGFLDWRSKQLVKTLTGVFFGQKDNGCSRPRVFYGIVMMELDSEFGFEVRKTVSAILLEFWPSSSGNANAVIPVEFGHQEIIAVAGCLECSFVEGAVLKQAVTQQESFEVNESRRKSWRISYPAFRDSVQLDVERIKFAFWINQCAVGFDCVVRRHACNADLTDAALPAVCSLNVNSNKTVLFEFHSRENRSFGGDGWACDSPWSLGRSYIVSMYWMLPAQKAVKKGFHFSLVFGSKIHSQAARSVRDVARATWARFALFSHSYLSGAANQGNGVSHG